MKENFKILLLLLLPVMAFGKKGDSEFKRVIAKEYANGSNSVLAISNKYGKIIIHTWKQGNVKAIITITGFGKNPSEAQNSANMVDIEESNANGEISLQTSYHPLGTGKLFNWGAKRDSKDYVNIDYEVYVPENLRKLELDNNFGDVFTDVLSFPATMGLNYCTYDIKEVQKSLTLNMNYCDKGRIGKADALTVRANYSNLKCDNIGSLNTRSNYSEYELGTVSALDSKSNYDDYKVVKAGTLNIGCNYSDFSIGELMGELNAKLVYGDLKVKSFGNNFKGGSITLTYADIKLQGMPARIPLQFRITLNNGDVRNNGLAMKSESSVKKASRVSYNAITSTGSEQSPTLEINGVYSDVSFGSN
ncbi:hypothetical protein [Chitinophaga sancti]|uniref:Adhesin domain-containing protein n=1 Tax=Chitinophaga sancti TaxID=1004 RepID=A0A1K1LVL3_9BACT|nr:hypothetical protein [Chitinophaga sancti]WQD64807.1 hypothetical protein U0033_10410 [Chitinophaga sancti]WQG89569.1 hypothetical protein SR876_32060 [Chitinophaga sancti]SFW14973.1 hypothetical protein SAMN05661012_00258 [Chitinophaga sancti]